MRTRMLIGVWLVAAAAAAVVSATGHSAASSGSRRSGVVYLAEPTLIGSAFIVGPVLFTHDDEAMGRGEPCTTVSLFDPAKGRATERIASYHCVPRRGTVVSALTITTRPSTLGFGCVLTSYQFAGDSEVHDLPQPADAH